MPTGRAGGMTTPPGAPPPGGHPHPRARPPNRPPRQLARASTEVKNRALLAVADALLDRADDILRANQHDVQGGQEAGLSPAVIDRLTLTRGKIEGIAGDVRTVAG